MRTAKTDQIGRIRRAHSHFVGFVMSRLIYSKVKYHLHSTHIRFSRELEYLLMP